MVDKHIHIRPCFRFQEHGDNPCYWIDHYDGRGGWASSSHHETKAEAQEHARRWRRITKQKIKKSPLPPE